jgi:hypothetical protein
MRTAFPALGPGIADLQRIDGQLLRHQQRVGAELREHRSVDLRQAAELGVDALDSDQVADRGGRRRRRIGRENGVRERQDTAIGAAGDFLHVDAVGGRLDVDADDHDAVDEDGIVGCECALLDGVDGRVVHHGARRTRERQSDGTREDHLEASSHTASPWDLDVAPRSS